VIDLSDTPCPLRDIEALVRAAGDYVQASDDLRPRVLETARAQHGEQRAQRWIGQLAACIVLLALFSDGSHSRVSIAGERSKHAAVAADANGIFAQVESKLEVGHSDVGWSMVEVFTELRRQQAAAFRWAL
jgi:hypothetical protein